MGKYIKHEKIICFTPCFSNSTAKFLHHTTKGRRKGVVAICWSLELGME